MSNTEKIVEKIQKLFALGQSPNQHEAELALKKAIALMDTHNIQQEDLNLKDEIGYSVYLEQGRVPNWVKLLTAGVAKMCSCKALFYSGGRSKKIKVWGKKVHREIFTYTMDYLMEAIDRLTKENAYGRGSSYCNSYRQGLVQNLTNRIEDLLKSPEVEEKAIVLRDKNLTEIDEFFKQTGKKIKNTCVSVGGNGFFQGLKDGDQINLNKVFDK